MKLNWILLLPALWYPTTWAASEVTPGVLYQPGSELTVTSMGLELTIPEQWQAILPPGAQALVMEPVGQLARMIVVAVSPADDDTLRQLMTQAQAMDTGSSLQPVGELKLSQGLYRQSLRMEGLNPQNLVASALGRLGENGTAVYILAMEPAGQGLFPALATRFIRSMKFTTPVESSAQNPKAASNESPVDWKQQLRGRTLRYLKTDSGLSVDKRLNLCSDGRFAYSDQDSYISSDAFTDFSAAGSSTQAGRWQIDGNRLQLAWNDGSSSRFTLSRRYVEEWSEWGTFVDDERWFNVANEVCQ